MADKKISDLSANSSLSGSEYVELVQSGANVKALSLILGLAVLFYRQQISPH